MEINNQPSFKAKLKVISAHANEARWQKIAKEFEAQTKKYPKDTFSINIKENGMEFWVNDKYPCDNYLWKNLTKQLLSLQDTEIVKKLKILFSTTKKVCNMEDEATAFLQKYGYYKTNVPEEVETRFYNEVFEGEKALIKRHLGQDKLLNANSDKIVINGV